MRTVLVCMLCLLSFPLFAADFGECEEYLTNPVTIENGDVVCGSAGGIGGGSSCFAREAKSAAIAEDRAEYLCHFEDPANSKSDEILFECIKFFREGVKTSGHKIYNNFEQNFLKTQRLVSFTSGKKADDLCVYNFQKILKTGWKKVASCTKKHMEPLVTSGEIDDDATAKSSKLIHAFEICLD